MSFGIVPGDGAEWITRPHQPGEPARRVKELSDLAGTGVTRANVWSYEPGARGKRHVHAVQSETFFVHRGTLTIYLGEPPERHDVPEGGVVHVEAGTPLQSVNHGADELVVYVHGTPPDGGADVLPSAL